MVGRERGRQAGRKGRREEAENSAFRNRSAVSTTLRRIALDRMHVRFSVVTVVWTPGAMSVST